MENKTCSSPESDWFPETETEEESMEGEEEEDNVLFLCSSLHGSSPSGQPGGEAPPRRASFLPSFWSCWCVQQA